MTKNEIIKTNMHIIHSGRETNNMVKCTHCSSSVRQHRLVRHMNRVHGSQSNPQRLVGATRTDLGLTSSGHKHLAGRVTRGGIRRCAFCGDPSVPGSDRCFYHE